MASDHVSIVQWVVGTGIGVLVVFVGILYSVISKKVDSHMCNKIHEMLDKKLDDLSITAKENMDKLHKMNLIIENIRGLLEGQIKTEAGRWDRSEKDKKG